MTARRRAVLTGLAGGLVVLTGCTSTGPYPSLEVRSTPAPPRRVDAGCPHDGAGLVAPRTGPAETALPATFVPDRARRCRLDDGGSPAPRGRMRITVETAPVTDAFLTSLRLPDQAFDPRDHAACAAVATPPVYVLLLDRAGRAYRPHLPEDPCGNPRTEVLTALEGLRTMSRTSYTVGVG